MNAANEVAVQAFLDGEIPFTGITGIVSDVVATHESRPATTIEAVLGADSAARLQAKEACAVLART